MNIHNSIFCSVILVSIFMLRVMQLLRCSSIFDWQKQFLFSENSFLEELASYWLLTFYVPSFVRWKWAVFTGNYGGKLMSCYLHSFKEYQSILETRQISHLYGSALFKIPSFSHFFVVPQKFLKAFTKRSEASQKTMTVNFHSNINVWNERGRKG